MTKSILTHKPQPPSKDAPPLLFVHGAYVGGWCWAENFLPYFASLGYHVSAIDLSRNGHGLATASLSDYLNAIEASIGELGEQPVLIGHSMGGYLVQQFLARQPIKAAVLMASVPPQGLLPTAAWLTFTNPQLLIQMHVMQWLGPKTVFSLYGIEGGRRPLFSPHLPDEKVVDYASKTRTESPLAVFEMSLPIFSWQSHPDPAEVLVMGAKLDTLIPASAIHATAGAFDTESVFVPETGHAIMLDHYWVEAANVIRDWLHERGM
ncbi:MAG: alpha/beta hydrolase [Gammaproteobacteria bacterium]|nr:alpha/beta hydrolase [Gammaproteobacteria bacterium]